jgi:hypothetical protein
MEFIELFVVDVNRRILELESQLAETANELEKTRNLLFMQYKINRDYKLEVRQNSFFLIISITVFIGRLCSTKNG